VRLAYFTLKVWTPGVSPLTTSNAATLMESPPNMSQSTPTALRQRAELLAWGRILTPDSLVFTREDGEGYHPQRFTQAWQRAARKAGVPVLPLHAARHQHATSGLAAGVDLLTMSRRLGHSSVAITGDIYSHVVEELDRGAAERTSPLRIARGS